MQGGANRKNRKSSVLLLLLLKNHNIHSDKLKISLNMYHNIIRVEKAKRLWLSGESEKNTNLNF